MTIDGTTQLGYSGTPLIEINGAGLLNVGLSLANPYSGGTYGVGGGDVIKGLIINRFLYYGPYNKQQQYDPGQLHRHELRGHGCGEQRAESRRIPMGQYGCRRLGCASNNTIGGTTAATVTSSRATPSTTVGGTAQLIATELFSDNSTADVTSIAFWTSSATAVATVSSTGLVTGRAAGSAIITVAFDTFSKTSSVTVTTSTTSTGIKTVAVSDSGYDPAALALPAQG